MWKRLERPLPSESPGFTPLPLLPGSLEPQAGRGLLAKAIVACLLRAILGCHPLEGSELKNLPMSETFRTAEQESWRLFYSFILALMLPALLSSGLVFFLDF